MKVVIIGFLVLVSLLPFGYIQSQNKKMRQAGSVRLVKDKPSVFITFERNGKRKPLEAGESDKGIWLRLHNNTRWGISFCGFGVSEEYGEVGIYYDVEEVPFEKSGGSYSLPSEKETLDKKEKPELPTGYGSAHLCAVNRLPPGKSIMFSIPREHLAENLAIKVAFNYGWEESEDIISGLEPQHSVYFYATSLPSEK
ncbi:MAG: hypothetical protein ACRD9R_03170 [Pyrinomonadaceae bacterium]